MPRLIVLGILWIGFISAPAISGEWKASPSAQQVGLFGEALKKKGITPRTSHPKVKTPKNLNQR